MISVGSRHGCHRRHPEDPDKRVEHIHNESFGDVDIPSWAFAFDIQFLIDFVKTLVYFLEFLLHLLQLGAFLLGTCHNLFRLAVISENAEPYDYQASSDAGHNHIGTVVEGDLY